MKNLAVSAALVMCAVALRAGAVPTQSAPADAILTAMTGDPLLNDQLGKLSFVSAIFPEATLVFGQQHDAVLAMPVSGGTLIHPWNRQEPYVAWETDASEVCAAISGEVTGVYHGLGDELLVQLSGEGGLKCVYGNLSQASVSTGDAVTRGQKIGVLLPGQTLAFEVRQNGLSVDPVRLLPSVQ